MLLQIKKAAVEDVSALAVLFNSYRLFYKQASDINAAGNFLSERLQRNESVIFMAALDGAAIGFCQLYPIFSSVGLQRTWLLNDLFVSEAARGKGVAAALLQKAKEFGIETNARWLLLQTGADNNTAQLVYEKNGWQRVTDLFYELPLVNLQ